MGPSSGLYVAIMSGLQLQRANTRGGAWGEALNFVLHETGELARAQSLAAGQEVQLAPRGALPHAHWYAPGAPAGAVTHG